MSALAHGSLPIDLSHLSTDLFIGGAWLPGSTGTRIEVLNPSTGHPIATVADASVEDAIRAVNAAATAAARWAATAPRDRAEILRRAFDLMIERLEWFAQLISIENGKA